MKENTHDAAVPFAIVRKLGLIRQRKVFVHVTIALVTALAVLLAAMGLAMLIDYLATLYDSSWRYVLTLTAVGAAVLTGIGWLLFAWQRKLGVERIAGDVDGYFPQLAERWTTVTRLGPDATNPQVIHPAMLRRVATEATSWEPHVEPQQVVSLSGLMRAMLGLTAITAVLGLAIVMNSYQSLVLLQRFWLPGSSISATRLENVPGDVVVGRGEPLALAASVGGIPVEQATLFLRSAADPQRAISLVSNGQEPLGFSHRVRTVETPFEYRFRAGDGQTDWFTVGVADRPEIDKLQLTVTPPTYTRQESKSFDKLPARITAIEKSQFVLALRPTVPVQSAHLRLENGKVVPLTADADGWLRWNTTLIEGFTLEPILTEPNGLTNKRVPKCQVSVVPDKPPSVKVLTPDDKLAVRPDDTIQIAFTASDDVGIGMAELLVYDDATTAASGEPALIAAIPIPLGDQQGARSVQQSVDLDLSKFVMDDGSQLSYEVRVREDRGGSAMSQAGQQTADQVASSEPAGNQFPNQEPATTQQASNPPAIEQVANARRASSGGESDRSSTPESQSQATAAPSLSNNKQLPPSVERENQQATQPTNSMPQASGSNKEQVAQSELRTGERQAPSSVAPTMPNEKPSAERLASNGQKPGDNSQPNIDSQPSSSAMSPGGNKPSSPLDTAASNAKPPASNSAPTTAAAKPTIDAKKLAENPPSTPASSNNIPSPGDAPPRTASSGRQSLAGGRNEPQSSPDTEQQANAQRQANAEQSSSARSQPATNNSEQQQAASPSDPPPGDSMTRRSLDVAQSSSSNRMRLSVDRWAGSFEGQQRAKLEMAIGPELEALDKSLAAAQQTARGVLDETEADKPWRGTHDRDITSAERSTVAAQETVKKLQDRSKDTPYAFIGLQVADISLAHIEPARTGLWQAMESAGDGRVASVRDAWQHLSRARELIGELRGQYERTRREFQLAEAVERVKKMYQVYIENSQTLLQTQDSDPSRYNRKMAEFELDDEYLKRLKEVLEMRRELQAELARILAEDSRLLRRYMDALRNRSNNLRENLAELKAQQANLNREVRAWTLVEEADRPRIAKVLMLRQVQDAAKIAAAAGELQSRYQAWLPLDRQSKDADLATATKSVQEMATAANELNATAQKFVADAQRATVAQPAASEPSEGNSKSAEAPPAADESNQALDKMLADAQSLYDQLNKLEVALRQLAAREEGAATAGFAANRLVETRRLTADASAWVRQLRAHKAGKYTGAAEVDQYRLATKTDELADKLGSIEQTLAGLMQRSDGKLPAPIAEKAREFITTLDKEVSPNQLASVYALHNNQLPRANERQKAAADALTRAEKSYDDMMRLAIKELDKLPVQDPVADLLDDPTLDELLAQLEQELPIEELLGIPQRPSNLQIVGDWLRPGSGMGGGSSGRMALNQLRQNDQQARLRLNQAYQRAIARALKEAAPQRNVEVPKPTKLSDWNRLVSKLGDDVGQGRDKAPPEQYRRAIEQYFSQISRVVAESEQKSPK